MMLSCAWASALRHSKHKLGLAKAKTKHSPIRAHGDAATAVRCLSRYRSAERLATESRRTPPPKPVLSEFCEVRILGKAETTRRRRPPAAAARKCPLGRR